MARGDTVEYTTTAAVEVLSHKSFGIKFTTSVAIAQNEAVYINASGYATPCATGTEDDCIGIAYEAKGSAAEIIIIPIGSVINTFTGATPGTLAYIQTDGTVTGTSSSYPIGRFISGTELLITKNAE